MYIQQIPAYLVNQAWPSVEGHLASALRHSGGEYTIDQLRMMLARGEHALLTVMLGECVVGAASVVFENHPSARIAFISAVGGRMISTPEIWGQLQNWCIEQGATRIRGACRPAAARLWQQKFGFKQRYIIVEKDL